MAIMMTTDMKEWRKVQSIIENVLSEREFYFNKSIILEIIKQQLENNNINSNIMNCSFFDVLFYKTIDNLIKNDYLYVINGIYIPSNYVDKNEVNLFYLTFTDNNNPLYINIDTLQQTSTLKKRDLLLTGGYEKSLKNSLKTPEVSLDDITYVYRYYIKEGLKKEEAINQVLNYYQIIPLQINYDNGITLSINKREKNNYLTRALKRFR